MSETLTLPQKESEEDAVGMDLSSICERKGSCSDSKPSLSPLSKSDLPLLTASKSGAAQTMMGVAMKRDGNGAGQNPSTVEAGVAHIKSQYLVQRERQVSRASIADDVSTSEGQPPPKKKKKRGQNKNRPRAAKITFSEQLCPSLYLSGDHTKCQFGEKCRYMHDIASYMANKLPDLGKRCALFETYGRCRYGLVCRYGGTHLTPEFKNVTNEEVYNPNRPQTTLNILPRNIQVKLRKQEIPFSKSEAYLKQLESRKSVIPGGKQNHPLKSDVVLTDSVSPTCESVQGLTDAIAESVQGCTVENSGSDGCTEVSMGEKKGVTGEHRADSDVHSLAKCAGVTDDCTSLRPEKKRMVDLQDKLFLAPLTTVGNLPFRRVCKELGADITCGEMAMCTNLLQGQQSEWALLRRHQSEDIFGVQVCGSFADSMTRCAELINTQATVDFVDINIGCPIDLVFKKGAGCALMGRQNRFESIVRGMVGVLDCPLTVKMRTGIYNKNWNAHKLVSKLRDWGVSLVTVHGRSREQRYTKRADWEYVDSCASAAAPMPVFGNGDILSFEDYNRHRRETGVAGIMIARGALIKPWIFTEIKEQRHWDISSGERLDILRRYANYGLEHWGSDTQGVENTRRFLLEWLSFLHRYIPVGVLEQLPQKINERPPSYIGRDDLETLMGSSNCQDWITISEMLLGPVPSNSTFLPKHKANAYS